MKFFSLIFIKNKKTFCLIILFFIISGLIIPNISLAVSKWWLLCPLCYINESIREKGLSEAGKDLTNAILVSVGTILTSITGGLRDIAREILDVVMNKNNFPSYTRTDNPIISVGWTASRDLANMFIVLGFVIIGIATTLRIQEYQAKKALFPLIIAALLINFSLLICGIFIDASNITMDYFLKSSGNAVQESMIQTIKDQFNALNEAYNESAESYKILSMIAGLVFYNIITFIIFILFAFLFIFRHIALWILVMLSPLAFVFYVFPFTKKFFQMWWDNFFQWCIIGIPAAFTLYLADKLMEYISSSAYTGGAYLVFFVPGFFLIAGFLFSLKTSAMGAGMAIKAFRGTGKFAGTGVTKLASLTAEKSGAARGFNALKSGATRMGERIGLVKPGTTAANQQTALNSQGRTNRLNTMSSDQLAQMVERGGRGLENNLDRAKATEILAKEGRIGKIKDIGSALVHAESYGAKKDDLYKHPLTAQYNRTKVAEYMKPVDMGGKNLSKSAAKQQLTNEAYREAKIPTIRTFDKNTLSAKEFIENTKAKTIANAGREFSADQISAVKSHTKYIQDEIKKITTGLPKGAPPLPKDFDRYQELTNKLAEISLL